MSSPSLAPTPRLAKLKLLAMDIELALKTAVGRLQSGRLDNEAQVKQAVILPILRALGWDDTDPEAFKPEYRAGKGLVDYALLDRGRPLVFIEAKQPGNLNASAENQLFGYANNRGVPFLVLTDGNRWDFYLSMADGEPKERQFYEMELQLDYAAIGYVKFLNEHLQKDSVVSRKARLSAEELLTRRRALDRARKAIAGVWRDLVKEPDETLRDLLAETVESKCGTKPSQDDVVTFLRDLPSPTLSPESVPNPPTVAPKPQPSPPTPKRSQARIAGFMIGGERIEVGTARGTLIATILRFDQDDPTFMERFYKASTTRRRRLVSRDRAELYDNPHLVSEAKDLGNGWWIGTNLSQQQIRTHIRTACTVARIEFGSELTLIES